MIIYSEKTGYLQKSALDRKETYLNFLLSFYLLKWFNLFSKGTGLVNFLLRGYVRLVMPSISQVLRKS